MELLDAVLQRRNHMVEAVETKDTEGFDDA
jgi:hypothetical protein